MYMYVYVCICMYMYVYVCICMYMYFTTHTHVHTCVCCKVLCFILSENDFGIKSKIYSLNLCLVLNYILYSQDVLSFRNLFFTLLF